MKLAVFFIVSVFWCVAFTTGFPRRAPKKQKEKNLEGNGQSQDSENGSKQNYGNLGKYFVYVNCTTCKIKSELIVKGKGSDNVTSDPGDYNTVLLPMTWITEDYEVETEDTEEGSEECGDEDRAVTCIKVDGTERTEIVTKRDDESKTDDEECEDTEDCVEESEDCDYEIPSEETHATPCLLPERVPTTDESEPFPGTFIPSSPCDKDSEECPPSPEGNGQDSSHPGECKTVTEVCEDGVEECIGDCVSSDRDSEGNGQDSSIHGECKTVTEVCEDGVEECIGDCPSSDRDSEGNGQDSSYPGEFETVTEVNENGVEECIGDCASSDRDSEGNEVTESIRKKSRTAKKKDCVNGNCKDKKIVNERAGKKG